MNQDQMNATYNSIRRVGKITTDFSPNDIVRLLIIQHDGVKSHITLYRGQVFAITKVTG